MAPDSSTKGGVGTVSHQVPDIKRREAGQMIVRQDQVEFLRLQGVADLLQTVHGRERAGQLTALEAQACQRLICDRVFNMEDFQGLIPELNIAKEAIIGYILEHRGLLSSGRGSVVTRDGLLIGSFRGAWRQGRHDGFTQLE